MENQQVNIDLRSSDSKPIFADEVAVAIKIKAFKNPKGDVEKEGQIAIHFIDMERQKSIGEFVITKNTAKALAGIIAQNIEALEKELSNKNMPKQPQMKTTAPDSSSIR
jgi:hypothetical protein